MNVVRVALPGYNAETDTDPSHFSIYSDTDNVLIKEFSRGAGDVTGTVSITHNLGYVPFYLAWGQVGTTRYRAINYYEIQSGIWRAYADTTKLYIINYSSNTYTGYKYYIFYDNVT